MRNELCPPVLQERLCFVDAHRMSHANFLVEHIFDFVFCVGAELSRMRFEPDVFRSIGAAHPFWKPVIELAGSLGLLIRRKAVSYKNKIFFGIADLTQVRMAGRACERGVHLPGRQVRVRNRAVASGLVNINITTCLLYTSRCV